MDLPNTQAQTGKQKPKTWKSLIPYLKALGVFFLLHINDFFSFFISNVSITMVNTSIFRQKNVVYRKSGNKPWNQEYMMHIKNNVT